MEIEPDKLFGNLDDLCDVSSRIMYNGVIIMQLLYIILLSYSLTIVAN